MLKLKRNVNALLICAGIFAGTTTYAQTPSPMPPQQEQQQVEVSDAELTKFAQAYQGIKVAEQASQKKMIAAVEGENLEIQQFNEIHQAKMQNQEVNASKEDLKKHEKAVAKIEAMQPEIQKQMEDIIIKEGLTVERFQIIATAMQADPSLQQRLQQLMAG